jgi:hypothetical protein
MASREPFQKVKIGIGCEEEADRRRLIYYFGGRAASQVICSDMRRQLIIAP